MNPYPCQQFRLRQRESLRPGDRVLYAATFQKWEEWEEHIVVDGTPVTIKCSGYRTYSNGQYCPGRNEKKRELKAARKFARQELMAVTPPFSGKGPKWKHPKRSEFLNA